MTKLLTIMTAIVLLLCTQEQVSFNIVLAATSRLLISVISSISVILHDGWWFVLFQNKRVSALYRKLPAFSAFLSPRGGTILPTRPQITRQRVHPKRKLYHKIRAINDQISEIISSLAFMYIHCEMDINVENVINRFAIKNRRLKFI